MNKPIPKSLHTVTVLVAMATIYIQQGKGISKAVELALAALGYTIDQDVYELASQVVTKLHRKG